GLKSAMCPGAEFLGPFTAVLLTGFGTEPTLFGCHPKCREASSRHLTKNNNKPNWLQGTARAGSSKRRGTLFLDRHRAICILGAQAWFAAHAFACRHRPRRSQAHPA